LSPKHWLALALLAGGCLPGDDRPEPATLLVTAEPSEATASGFSTDDGWTVEFDRFVTAIGDIDLDGPDGWDDDSCNSYSETHYEWLFDFTVVEREKVGLVHGLGACAVEYRFRGPSGDTVLGPGATTQDVEFMDAEGTDAYAEQEEATLVVVGEASRGGESKRFEWVFRREYEIEKCEDLSGDGYVSELYLNGGTSHTLPIVVRGEELFRRSANIDAPLQFDLFAQADVNGDGSITLAELVEVEAPEGESFGSSEAEGTELEVITLADLVYEVLLPRVTHIAGGGDCEAELRGR
jgi:hypothetical protein